MTAEIVRPAPGEGHEPPGAATDTSCEAVQDTRAAALADVGTLLRACCLHCRGHPGHLCDHLPPVEFDAVTDPGRLDPVGPLAPGVQKRLETITAQSTTRANRVRLLVDGTQSYAAMLELVRAARAQLLFENFIFREDAVGRAFASELRRRADEGLDVRILHDPFGSLMSRRPPIGFSFYRSSAAVRVYNPPLPRPSFLRLGRDHRKVVVQDRARTVVGGLCLADVWLGNCVTSCTWRDSAVLAEGPAAAAAADEFDRVWRDGVSFTPQKGAPRPAVAPQGATAHAGDVPVRVLADRRRQRRAERALIEVFAAAREEILVTNPYVVPTRAVFDALLSAARRGLSVRLLLPRVNNHRAAGLAAEHILGPLLHAGVEVWLWNGPLVHAKTVAVDRVWSLVGSTNLDSQSLWRNAELNLEVHGSAFGEQMADLFRRDCLGADPLTFAAWRGRSRARRLLARTAALGARWW